MVSLSAYRAARDRTAHIDRTDRGLIVVSGADRASYLQGLFTNDIVGITAGGGCYSAYLTAQGRMITDVFVYELGDVMLLTVPRGRKDAVLAKLDQFIFSEDVQLGDVTGTFSSHAVVGPGAADVLSRVVGNASRETLGSLPEHGNRRVSFGGEPAIVVKTTDTGEPGYDVYVQRPHADAFIAAIHALDVIDVDEETAEAIRVEAGVPRFDRDMDDETIPLEAGIESRAISLTKGCYVGQEVIIRVLHRGHGRVARKLIGLTLESDSPPASGTVVRAADREIGSVTSAAISPALGRPIALAYLHRDFLDPGTVVIVEGTSAIVTALPFIPRHSAVAE